MPFEVSSQADSVDAINAKLQEQLDLIGEALDASQDGFAIWQAVRNEAAAVCDFVLVFMNKAGAVQTGRTAPQIIGKNLEEVVGPEAEPGLFQLFSKALAESATVKDVVSIHSPDGWSSEYENTVVPLSRDQVMATYRDVSEERREHGRLVWLTEHDYLTGMPNRAKLQKTLNEVIQNAREGDTLLAFVFIDIDYFKNVNDTFGHAVGDELLVNFIKRIRHSLPESALVARIAGDEFAILMRDVKSELHLRELMDEVFNSMKRPFTHDGASLEITCSAGCVLTDGSEIPDEVLRIADKSMYQAKHEGRNCYRVQPVLKAI